MVRPGTLTTYFLMSISIFLAGFRDLSSRQLLVTGIPTDIHRRIPEMNRVSDQVTAQHKTVRLGQIMRTYMLALSISDDIAISDNISPSMYLMITDRYWNHKRTSIIYLYRVPTPLSPTCSEPFPVFFYSAPRFLRTPLIIFSCSYLHLASCIFLSRPRQYTVIHRP